MAATVRNMVGFWIPQETAYGSGSGSTVSNGAGEGKVNFDTEHLEAFAGVGVAMGSDTVSWLHGEIKPADFGGVDFLSIIIYCETLGSVNKGPQLAIKIVSGSPQKYVVGLYQSDGFTLIAWGATEWTFGVWYEFRIEGGVFGAVLDYGVKGSIANEVTDATYTQLLNTSIHIDTSDNNESSIYCVYRNLAVLSSTTRADQMAEPNIQEKTHNGSGTPDYDDFNLSGGSDKSILVDDWESGDADDDTTYLISAVAADETDRQTLLTDALTLADVIAVKIYGRMRLDIDAKDATSGVMISDNFNNSQGVRTIRATDAWFYIRAVFNTNGNSLPWSQGRLNAMEYGFSHTDGGDITNVRGSAVHCEALAMVADAGVDPPKPDYVLVF